jgi:membrane protease YdiL (CAAX protease family)
MSSEPSAVPQAIQQEPPAALMPLKHRILRVFWTQDGLRPFWGPLVFVALIPLLRSAVTFILHSFNVHLRANDFTVRTDIIRDGLAFLMVLAATAIVARLEKRSLGAYGLAPRAGFGSRFFEGLLWGLVAECATIFTLYLSGNVTFHGFDQRGTAAFYYAAMWAVAFLMVGLFEESLFRGYPQFALARGIGFWPAAIVLSALFGFAHLSNTGETWVGALSAGLGGIAFCASLKLTGDLWFAIGLHAAWDWAETYFFGVPDSGNPAVGHLLNTTLSGSKWMTGGTVGPEGSLIELLVVSAMIGLLFWRFRRSPEKIV